MDPVTVSVLIDAPRERVFDYLQDIANRPEFTDHFLVHWRLTRVDPVGAGAGARFRMKRRGPARRFAWGDVTLAEVLPSYRIVEIGRAGKGNRVRTLGVYELTDGPDGTTHVEYTIQTEPHILSDRIVEALGQRGWVKRRYGRALRRLRSILEVGERRGERATVAGG